MQNIKMRVVGGKYIRRPISYDLDNKLIRPTKDIVRQGIFNALRNDIKGKAVLDLFAGTGALGIEALSQGAKSATFVDSLVSAQKIIRSNTSYIEESLQIIDQDYKTFLQNCNSDCYDVIFLDPPYHLDVISILDEVIKTDILCAGGIIVIESDKALTIVLENSRIRTYKYGITHVTIIWRTI